MFLLYLACKNLSTLYLCKSDRLLLDYQRGLNSRALSTLFLAAFRRAWADVRLVHLCHAVVLWLSFTLEGRSICLWSLWLRLSAGLSSWSSALAAHWRLLILLWKLLWTLALGATWLRWSLAFPTTWRRPLTFTRLRFRLSKLLLVGLALTTVVRRCRNRSIFVQILLMERRLLHQSHHGSYST